MWLRVRIRFWAAAVKPNGREQVEEVEKWKKWKK
jgi:hypothetical protein